MGGVGNLVGHHGAADAGMLRPPGYAGLEKSAVDNQLPAALEQVEQARSAVRPLELVGLLHREPWHPPTLRRQRVTGATTLLLFHEELLARCLPLLPRHYFPQLHRFGFLHGAHLSSFASFASVFLVMARRLGLSGAPLGARSAGGPKHPEVQISQGGGAPPCRRSVPGPVVDHQPRRAALIAATSIFFMPIIASNARFAWAPPAASASVSTRGVICQEIPHLSLHQPHALSWPPLPTMASQ